MDKLIVVASQVSYREGAVALADHLKVPFFESLPEDYEGLFLRMDEEGLTLTDGRISLRGDFSEMASRLKLSNLTHELLVKAAKIKDYSGPVMIVDATAGMGADSFLLAASGFEVQLFEYDPVIAALLKDALGRALQDKNEKLVQAARRMHVHEGDSIEAMRRMGKTGSEPDPASGMDSVPTPAPVSGMDSVPAPASGIDSVSALKVNSALTSKENPAMDWQPDPDPLSRPDVIFLDPMFPQRTKSALVKKKFQLLQRLESPCSDADEMLRAALSARPFKIVIKRPLKGPYLADQKPSYSLSGKAIRYDCIVLPENRRQ